MDENEAVVFPQNLSALSVETLSTLETQALTEFDALSDPQTDIDDTGVQRLVVLADGIEAVKTELTGRRATQQERLVTAASQRDRVQRMRTVELMTAETPVTPVVVDDEPETGTPTEPVVSDVAPVATPTITPSAESPRRRASLAVAQARAPHVPSGVNGPAMHITAAAPTSGVQIGAQFADVDALVSAVQSHARSLITTRGTPSFLTVATIANEYEEVVDGGDRTSLQDFEYMARRLRTPEVLDALVAGGGWCSPSEIRYNFFNVACQDGMVDLPTFGVKRGGVQVPISPSLADVFTGTFTNATNPWLWTEADDILTVTGVPNKPVVRVPCAGFVDRRLECYGIALTAGNLTDNAWPEATRNFLSLLMSAHFHASNQRYLQTMAALSSSIVSVTGGVGTAISADLPDAVAIAANDYRVRYGMCENDVLEVILPRWVRDAIRGDLSRRSGDATYLMMTDAQVNALFTARNVRVQFVMDWQVRSAGQFGGTTPLTAWPSTVDFMIYAAGTFMLGNGLTLDLGVVRDSVLNAENDHTAAWTEECHLITRVGNESRQYRVPVCVGGKTGGTFTSCFTIAG